MTEPDKRDPPEPLAVDGVPVIVAGTAFWAVALILALVFHSWLSDSGRGWWIWVCVAGTVLGLVGIPYLRRFQRRTSQEN